MYNDLDAGTFEEETNMDNDDDDMSIDSEEDDGEGEGVDQIVEPGYQTSIRGEYLHLAQGVSSDTLVWRWTSNCKYYVASAYGVMFIGSVRPLGANLI
jgi:hypothetical protein